MKVLITGTGGMGAHISKVLIDKNVDTSLYGTCRQTDAISKIVDIDKVEMHKGDILDSAKLESVIKDNNIDHIIHMLSSDVYDQSISVMAVVYH